MYRFYGDMVNQFRILADFMLRSMNLHGGIRTDENSLKEIYEKLTGEKYRDARPTTLGERITFAEVYNTLAFPEENSDHDMRLIEEIVGIINGPYAQGILGPKVLKSLRKAVLNPDELLKFKAEVQAREMSCGTCGRTLVPEEGVTFRVVEGTPIFICMACTRPIFIRCSCGKVKQIGDIFRRRMRKETTCACETTAVETPTEAPEPIFEPEEPERDVNPPPVPVDPGPAQLAAGAPRNARMDGIRPDRPPIIRFEVGERLNPPPVRNRIAERMEQRQMGLNQHNLREGDAFRGLGGQQIIWPNLQDDPDPRGGDR